MRSLLQMSPTKGIFCDSQNKNRGFTIVETLVSIGIIGLLMAILLPAVQSVRQTAAKSQCLNNFRQIGIAVQNYEVSFRVLPGMRQRPLFDLLPFVEQVNVFSGPHLYGLQIPVFLCPSDGSHDYQLSPYSYLMNEGSRIGVPNGVSGNPNRIVQFSHVSDGLSTTAMFSERRSGFSSRQIASNSLMQCRDQPWRCVWNLQREYGPGEEEAFGSDCRSPSQWRDVSPMVADNREIYTSQFPYSHTTLPNSPSCYATTNSVYGFSISATSSHRGGVNLLLCDGSARLISSEIDGKTWRALGSRDGHEIVGDF